MAGEWLPPTGSIAVELAVPAASLVAGEELSKYTIRGGHRRLVDMLIYAALFSIVALAAAVLGFSGLAAGAAGLAKILFWLFLAIFVVSLIVGWGRRSWR